MMKRILFFALICLSVTTAVAQPKKVVADKIIGVLGDKIVLKSDVENSIADMQRQGMEVPPNAGCLTLEQALGVKALVLQAERDSLPISEEEVMADIENQIRYFTGPNGYGSKEKLEEIAGKSIYQIREDFKEGFRERRLANAMRAKIIESVRITPNEVKAYFETLPKDSLPYYETELEVGQVVLFPKASRASEELVIEDLKEYKAQLESGRRDMKTLAALYSEDPGSKDNAGQYEINRSEKQWDPMFMAKAFALKEGQVSAPFKTRFGYHIIQMVSRLGDDAVVRHILRVPRVSRNEIADAMKKLDSIRVKLVDGTLSFGEAVSKHSEDESSKYTAGRKTNAEGGTLLTIDQLDKDLVGMIKNLKVGEYSEPVEFTDERGKRGVRIVYIMSKTEPHRENLRDDYNRIAQRALEEKKNNVLERWFLEQMPKYYIRVDEEYRSCEQIKSWLNQAAQKTETTATPK